MRLKELKKKFKEELHGAYPAQEIDSFFKLLCDAYLNLSPIETVLQSDNEIESVIQEKFTAAINRLKIYEPIQYILGETEFFGLPFKVTPNTLIPRPETEELVQLVLQEISDTKVPSKFQILDIGTGSGCIAIALAKNLSNVQVSAMDVSKEALKVVKENAQINKVDVHFFQGDILTLNTLPNKYNAIVSNPPYVRILEKKMMEPNVLKFEPSQALFVEDDDPLLFYRTIAQLAKLHLVENGKLFFEINEYLGDDLMAFMEEEGFDNVVLVKDIYGKNRMLQSTYNAKNQREV